MARVSTSSFTYLTKNRPNQKAPVRSVIYDVQDNPISIVYNIAQQGNTETITIDWSTGHPTIDGVEFKDHIVNIWEARLERVQESNLTVSQTIPVSIDPANGFATQKLSITDTVVEVVNTNDRISIAIRNWSDPALGLELYVSEDNTTLTDGWPLLAREGTGIDLDPGASVYLVANSGTIDVRILEVLRV